MKAMPNPSPFSIPKGGAPASGKTPPHLGYLPGTGSSRKKAQGSSQFGSGYRPRFKPQHSASRDLTRPLPTTYVPDPPATTQVDGGAAAPAPGSFGWTPSGDGWTPKGHATRHGATGAVEMNWTHEDGRVLTVTRTGEGGRYNFNGYETGGVDNRTWNPRTQSFMSREEAHAFNMENDPGYAAKTRLLEAQQRDRGVQELMRQTGMDRMRAEQRYDREQNLMSRYRETSGGGQTATSFYDSLSAEDRRLFLEMHQKQGFADDSPISVLMRTLAERRNEARQKWEPLKRQLMKQFKGHSDWRSRLDNAQQDLWSTLGYDMYGNPV